MTSLLTALRQTAPHTTARRFLTAQAGCWIQYYDDTPAKNPAKSLSARTLDPETARRKQRDACAVTFSLQAFGDSRTKEGLLCLHNLGVDVDLIPAAARAALTADGIDRRKEAYLRLCLRPFPLEPHWVVETRHGFHLVFRIQPQREPQSIRDAQLLNHRLVRALRGDRNAVLLTQLLRVPGTLQFKMPSDPFLCRLLVDNAAMVAPYALRAVRTTLDAWEPAHVPGQPPHTDRQPSQWRQGLGGVPEGERNATAASLAGKILGRLPDELWDTAGWGGLKEWNGRNTRPLPERELRAVFESIATRESRKRRRIVPNRPDSDMPAPPPAHAQH